MANLISDSAAAAIGGSLLAIYLGIVVYGIVAPASAQDPQRGQAIGCLAIVAVALIAAGTALGFAWYNHRRGVLLAFAAVAALPLAHVLVSVIANLFRRAKRSRNAANQ
jgi:Na+/proline symporter